MALPYRLNPCDDDLRSYLNPAVSDYAELMRQQLADMSRRLRPEPLMRPEPFVIKDHPPRK